MRKAIGFILSLTMIISIPFKAFAENLDWTSTEKIEISKEQNQFEVEFLVNSENPYAGVEFGIQLSEGIKIKSVIYGADASKAGPTEARGLTWFSLFSGSNKFSGQVVAIATLEYTGKENTSIVVDNISLYSTNGSLVDTESINPRKVIEINREGATNVVIPPPVPEDNNGTNEENNSDKEDNSDGSNTNNNINNSGSGDKSSGSNNSNSSKNNSSIASSSSNKVTNKSTSNNNSKDSNTNDAGDKTKDEVDIESEKNSKSVSNKPNNNIQNNASSPIKVIIAILLIMSIGGNAVLGYFIIKNKNNK